MVLSCHVGSVRAFRLTQLQKTRYWLKLPSLKFKVNMLYLVFGARALN